MAIVNTIDDRSSSIPWLISTTNSRAVSGIFGLLRAPHTDRAPITSIAQFGPNPLLAEPDMVDLGFCYWIWTQNGKVVSASATLHVHHAQRQYHADGPLQVSALPARCRFDDGEALGGRLTSLQSEPPR